MKKKLSALLLPLCLLLLMSGCSGKASKTISYTYKVETGDSVSVSLDASDEYSLSSDIPFVITKEDKKLSQGTFITADNYAAYVEAAKADEKAKVIESKTRDGIEYTFWSYNDSEYNYAILIKDSKTGVLVGNDVSESSAKECFNRLTFTKK